jgi:hypothetical protein
VGRQPKIVNSLDNLDRRELGYYSTPQFVAEFLTNRILALKPGARRILDPCIGKGELTGPFKSAGCHVTGYDVVDMSPKSCDEFFHTDFLRASIEQKSSPLFNRQTKQDFDVVVANPPYNCHEVDYIRTHKVQLIQRFGKAAVLNMYALFLRAIIDLAPDGCIIGLVTHDSFLTATGHQELRKYIVENCVIHNLHLCPTNLFFDQGADVRTCLLVLEKTNRKSQSLLVSNRPSSVQEFKVMLSSKSFQSIQLDDIILNDARDSSEFTIGVPADIRQLFFGRRLADIAPCITGISTGDDRKYIRSTRSDEFSVPFYKNPASRQFFAEPDGYLCSNYEQVGREVPNFMIRNKGLIFRGGISCSSMGVKFGATIRPENSACGVNPNIVIDKAQSWWLLAFLNSRLCMYMTKGVIIRGNMITAGYASRIPVPNFSAVIIEQLSDLGSRGFLASRDRKSVTHIRSGINEIIEHALQLSPDSKDLLGRFEQDPTRLA